MNSLVEEIAGLRAEGKSYAEIGRRLGKSKNAIVGIANRAGLIAPLPLPAPSSDFPQGCRWPHGHSPNWQWCGALPLVDRNYCAEHRALAYWRPSR